MAARLPNPALTQARLRSLFSSGRLPPGDWINLDRLERSNRCFLLEQAGRVGPVFKALVLDEPWICVLGLARGRRLLREHAAALKPQTLHLQPLFPEGFLRQMEGETHRRYRQSLNRAIQPEDLTACRPALAAFAASALADYRTGDDESPDTYITTLNSIASGMLVRLFFGADPGTPIFDRLMGGYQKLGPYGLVWNIGPAQIEAFTEIRDLLLDRVNRGSSLAHSSILGRLHEDGALDETILGNLIYMVEMGRYDTYSLFRWLTKYVADHPDGSKLIAAEASASPVDTPSYTEAFVLETLRMDQSERLLRKIQSDFVFDGHFFPKGATLRVCLWESHKNPETFPDPLRFDPDRFLPGEPGSDEFAPFGLDRHQCPLGDIAVRTAMIFLRQLASGYHVLPSGDGLPVRGAYHWEPASRFSVQLRPRSSPPQ